MTKCINIDIIILILLLCIGIAINISFLPSNKSLLMLDWLNSKLVPKIKIKPIIKQNKFFTV